MQIRFIHVPFKIQFFRVECIHAQERDKMDGNFHDLLLSVIVAKKLDDVSTHIYCYMTKRISCLASAITSQKAGGIDGVVTP